MVRVLPRTDWLRLRPCGETRTLPSGPRVALLSKDPNWELSVTLMVGPRPPAEAIDLLCFVTARAVVGLSNGGWPPKGCVVAPAPANVPLVVAGAAEGSPNAGALLSG